MTKIVGLLSLLIVPVLLAACVAPASPQSAPANTPAPATGLPVSTATPPAPPQPTTAGTPAGTVQAPAQPGTTAPTITGIQMKRGGVSLDSKNVAYDAAQKQAVLNLSGSLPTPCHQLKTDVSQPDAQNRIDVSVYTLVNPTLMCTQVIKPFETAVPLGPLAPGSYTVYVNAVQVGVVAVP